MHTNKLAKFLRKTKLSSSEIEFLPAAVEILERPSSPFGRVTLWAIFFLVAAILLWAIIGTVDEVAVAPGRLIPSGNVKVIQPEDKGVIKSILVKEGQRVTKNQILAELDTTVSGVDVQRTRKDISYFTLETERLLAELQDKPFTPQLMPGIEKTDFDVQTSLYQSRMEEYRSKVRAAEDSISQNLAALRSLKINKAKNEELFKISSEKETKIEKLVEENAVAKFVLLDYRAQRIDLEQTVASQEADMEKLQYAIAQSRQNLESIKAERNREITSTLVESRRQLQTLLGDMRKAEERNRLTQLKSPIDGTVHQIAIHTVGGVVTAAQTLMVVVPHDVTLEAEAWVANKDIGFIQLGQDAEVKLETFDFQKYGTIDAKVTGMSPDAIQDKDGGLLYRVTLDLSQDYMRVDGKKVLFAPGMALTAEIKTRQKRIIEFFLDPFRRYGNEALRER